MIQLLIKNQIIQALLFVLGLLFLYQIKELLVALFIAYIIMAALVPSVRFLKQYKVPTLVAVLLSYGIFLAVLILLIFPLVPFFISQIQSLFNRLPNYLDVTAKAMGIEFQASSFRSLLTANVGSIGANAFSVTARIFGELFSVLTVFAVSLYLLIDHDKIRTYISNHVSAKQKEKTVRTIDRIEEKLGGWLRGQLILSLAIGILTWVALTLLGLPYALPLALLAGMLEIVPTIGPIIAAIPAIIVALSIDPTKALVVALVYVGIQILENNLLVPRIMEKAVGLHPVVIIIGVIIGSNLMGVAGALLSVPFISLLVLIWQTYRE